ncbi:MAG: preprotein translocase subunit SecE [Candidatus Omnitrophota bacterium]
MKFVEKTKIFFNEVTVEMKKVSWSSRNELLVSAWIVVVSVIIFTIVLGFFDFSFSELISWILKQRF